MGLAAGFFDLRQRIIAAQNRYTYRSGAAELVLTSSGRLWDTHFQQPLKDYRNRYHYNGSESAQRRFVTWSKGLLDIGVNQSGIPAFKGLFAVTEPSFPAGSFVETSMKPIRAVPQLGQVAETIVAVQTATTHENAEINYVIAALTQISSADLLQLGYANGVYAHAKTFILRNYRAPHLLTTVSREPVTISTNGLHDLKIWLGSRLLLNQSRLALHIIPPFQVYLEVQSKGLRYAARFHSLLIYRSNHVAIKGLPRDAHIQVLGSRGTRLAQGISGHHPFLIGLRPPRLQRWATISITVADHTTTFRHVALAGGDTYAYHG